MHIVRLESVEALRAAAGAWDDLWQRSQLTRPLLEAEPLAQFVEQFVPRGRFSAVAIERDGRYDAAIPLVRGRCWRMFGCQRMAANPWFPAGDFLLDSACPTEAVLKRLVAGFRELRVPLLWLEPVPLDAPHWQKLIAAFEREGMPTFRIDGCHVGLVDMARDWATCQAGWTRNHRQNLRKKWRRLNESGTPRLVVHDTLDPGEIETLLRRGFEVEAQSWKGAAGSAVLSAPGMFEFHLRQARELARRGQLELDFLECDGRPIAFHYAAVAKDTYAPLKIAYDEAFGEFSPGHLLLMGLLEQWHRQNRQRTIDFSGPLTDSTAKWATRAYTLGRCVVATGAPGRMALDACRWGRPIAKTLRRRLRPSEDSLDYLSIEPKAKYPRSVDSPDREKEASSLAGAGSR